ncbi:MAG: hypothetical protein ACRDQZ_15475, partial [Mycobacteriales bacterium]
MLRIGRCDHFLAPREDIITDLSKVSALSVVARNTAFTFKGRSVDVPQVARQLNVSHVLEGSVRKAGGRVRITAQLIDGAAGDHVWAERYDRDLTDIFALQDETSRPLWRREWAACERRHPRAKPSLRPPDSEWRPDRRAAQFKIAPREASSTDDT